MQMINKLTMVPDVCKSKQLALAGFDSFGNEEKLGTCSLMNSNCPGLSGPEILT